MEDVLVDDGSIGKQRWRFAIKNRCRGPLTVLEPEGFGPVQVSFSAAINHKKEAEFGPWW